MDDTYSYESPSIKQGSPMISYRKDAKKGVKFTFMTVGELGTGKTTFINSLLNKKVANHRFESEPVVGDTKVLSFTSSKSVSLPSTSVLTTDFNAGNAHEEPGIALTETKVDIIDDNVKLQLSVIDTPGYGDNLNNDICFSEIENYLKQQFDLVLAEETRIRRNPRFVDSRVHVMLYFITPNGHGLKELDINCMKRLSKYVNIIPVVSKADSFTEDELKHFKKQVRIDIEKFNVPTFQFDNSIDEYDENEDYDLIQECKFLAKLQPFAIIGSEDEFEVNDRGTTKIIKARQYPWGLVDINNPKYSDFPILKSVLLGSHLQDLKDLTHYFLYESYRTERLSEVTGREQEEFHDAKNSIPSLSNLAQLTSDNSINQEQAEDDNNSMISKPKSTLEEPSTPKIRDNTSFMSSTSTVSLDGSPARNNSNNNSNNNTAFKRLSIAPQRNQLRQISETVPYVITHERLLERQQKLEEMEMESAKELANRAALLEKRAAELKAREKSLHLRGSSEVGSEQNGIEGVNEGLNEGVNERLNGALNEALSEPTATSETSHDASHDTSRASIRKEETLTDLHSIVDEKN